MKCQVRGTIAGRTVSVAAPAGPSPVRTDVERTAAARIRASERISVISTRRTEVCREGMSRTAYLASTPQMPRAVRGQPSTPSPRGGLPGRGPPRAATWFSFVLPAWPPFRAGRIQLPRRAYVPRAARPGSRGRRRSCRGRALAAVAWRGTGGGDASRVNSRRPPGRRALRATARGNLGRCGAGRRGRLAEGRRDQLVELVAQPLRVSADHVRERSVQFTGVQVHADQTPRNPR